MAGASNSSYAGGLSAVLRGRVENCEVEDVVVEDLDDGKSMAIGGIAGYATNSSLVRNCYVQGLEINVKNNRSLGVGGIVGRAIGGLVTIEDCYSIGKINCNDDYIGGIVGNDTNSNIQNCYSKVDILGAGDNIGGIVGFDSNATNYKNNIALGSIYSSKNEVKIRRIAGGTDTTTANYAYKNQLINGYMSQEKLGASELLSYETLKKEETYKNKLGWTSYDTSQVKDGVLPKLYKKDSNELLPNQKDIVLDKNIELEINDIEVEKVDVNTISIQVKIYNPSKIELIGLKIEDMDYKVNSIATQGEYTFMRITATPTRYYDSYRISEIWYKTEGKEYLKEISAKIEVQFYKELYSYEDWQSIEIGTYQNYRLMNDIDFAGKTDMKMNVTMGRLESEGNKHALKNVTASFNDVGQGMIQTLQYSMKNIIFENINITNTKDYTGIISYCNGDIENIDFRTITIEGGMYIGCIGSSNNNISNIQMEKINIFSKGSFVGGLVGIIEMGKIKNLNANNIEIEGIHQVGGIAGKNIGSLAGMEKVVMRNSKITGISFIGGVGGMLGTVKDAKVLGTVVSGEYRVGCVSGYLARI